MSAGKQTGRPSKLTDAVAAAIVQAVAGGVPYARAAALVDVDEFTAYEWLRRGESRHERASTPRYAHFAQEIQKAKSQDEARRVLRINQAGQGGTVAYQKTTTFPDGRVVREVKTTEPQWTADAWYLERTQPEVYGRRERIEHGGLDGKPLQIQVIYAEAQAVPQRQLTTPVRLVIAEG